MSGPQQLPSKMVERAAKELAFIAKKGTTLFSDDARDVLSAAGVGELVDLLRECRDSVSKNALTPYAYGKGGLSDRIDKALAAENGGGGE